MSNRFLSLSHVIYEIITKLLEGEGVYRVIKRNMAKEIKFLHRRMKSKIHKVFTYCIRPGYEVTRSFV